ncbi:MAG: hemolysin family protein [Eubacterium sp.]
MDDDGSPLNTFGKGLRKLFGRGKFGTGEDVTEEEIMSMVNEGHEQGVLLASEAEMINNIVTLGDKEAKDIMTHRKSIAAIDATMTLREVLREIEDKGFSRYPVYSENIDNIIGVIHIKDILNLMLKQDVMDVPVTKLDRLVSPVPFIPETRNIDVLFKNMQSQKKHMVIVVDEYGQTAGLVSMEDILEEIVGNILDEHDAEEMLIIHAEDGSYLMDGMTELEEVCQILDIGEQEELEDFDTLNGFIVSQIDRIPSDGEVFQISAYGYFFEVLLVENKMIRTVRVTKEKQTEDENLSES